MTMCTKGSIGVRWQGNVLSCRPADLRPHIGFLVYLTNHTSDAISSAMCEFRCAISNLHSGMHLIMGYMPTKTGTHERTPATDKHFNLYRAAMHLGESHFGSDLSGTVRVGHACATVPAVQGFASSWSIWWLAHRPNKTHQLELEGTLYQLSEHRPGRLDQSPICSISLSL